MAQAGVSGRADGGAAGGQHPAPGPIGAAALLALLMGLQPVTTDLYLPALPALTRELGATTEAAQLTLSALILAFGLGQLVWGPAADRNGRRPVLLASLALYAVASVAGTLAPTIGWLVGARTLQGFAMAGAVVCARAMLRDLFAPQEGAQVMALALSCVALVAIAGPVAGGLIATWAGWRAALAAVTAYGAVALAVVRWRVPETLAQRNPRAATLGPMLAAWADIARHRGFVAWTLLVSCSFGGVFCFLVGSSFVYIGVLGLSPGRYGLVIASASAAYLVGTWVCRGLIRRRGIVATVHLAAWLTAAGGIAFAAAAVASAWLGSDALPWLLLAQPLFAAGHGMHQPCGQTGTVAAFPRRAGAASALGGFVMSLVAFGVGYWLGRVLDDTVLPFAATMAFFAAATCTVAWTLVQRHGAAH
jgi:DHA1 family bicyclomycin/chloramphenicol resistance-like MFS transporter